jgi:hypothetical protein
MATLTSSSSAKTRKGYFGPTGDVGASNSLDIENQCHDLYHPSTSAWRQRAKELESARPRFVARPASTKNSNKKKYPSLNVSDLETRIEEDDVEEVSTDDDEVVGMEEKVPCDDEPAGTDGGVCPAVVDDGDFIVIEDITNPSGFDVLVDGWSVLDEDDEGSNDDDETSSQWTFASEAQQSQVTFLSALLSTTGVTVAEATNVLAAKPMNNNTFLVNNKLMVRRTTGNEGGDFDFEGEYLEHKSDGEKGRTKGAGGSGRRRKQPKQKKTARRA